MAEKLRLALGADTGIIFDLHKKRFYLSGPSTIMGELPRSRVFLETPSLKDMREILQQNFGPHFLKQLSVTRLQFDVQLKRELITLAKPLDIVDSWTKMLANIRLCNRSQKRLIRNCEDNVKKVEGDVTVAQSFRFNAAKQHSVYDKQDITVTGARRDKVQNLGTYEAICKKIQNIVSLANNEKIDISDGDIAWWIRCIIQGRTLYPLTPLGSTKLKLKKVTHEDIIEQLVDISYLLFGTEAARNPMVLINHQMILDLMIEKKYSFSYFFNWRHQINNGGGGYAPVSSSGSYAPVGCGRRLNSATFFGQYFPVGYLYPGPDDVNSTALIEYLSRHESVMRLWLQKCGGIKNLGDYPKIIAAIIDALPIWYLKIDLSHIHVTALKEKIIAKDDGGYSPTKGANLGSD